LGKDGAVVASTGRCGRLILAVTVDRILLSSVSDTVRGVRVRTVFGVGHAAVVRKWPVLPVLAMAVEHREGEKLERVG
jgi:hypothetical protein